MSITLQFGSLEELAKFKTVLQTNNVEINIHQFTLSCRFSEEEIKEAIIRYGAKRISSQTYIVS